MFKPGQPKLAGRRKGTPNKATFEIQQACREYGPAMIARLVQLVSHPDGHVAIRASQLLLAYAYGKPRERIEVSGTNSGPFRFTLNLGDAAIARQPEGLASEMEGTLSSA